MRADITQLLIVFDELLLPPTNEELGIYWFRSIRNDNLTVTISFSSYEDYVSVLVYNKSDVAITNIHMKNCSEIRVLDEQNKCLEIIHENRQGRCFLALLSDTLVTYDE